MVEFPNDSLVQIKKAHEVIHRSTIVFMPHVNGYEEFKNLDRQRGENFFSWDAQVDAEDLGVLQEGGKPQNGY